MRAIDADRLKEHIDKLPALPDGNFAGNHSALKALINMQPSVEPERKTGKWLPHMVTAKCESIDRDVCSECRTCFYGEPTWSWKYCPMCGAKMEVDV